MLNKLAVMAFRCQQPAQTKKSPHPDRTLSMSYALGRARSHRCVSSVNIHTTQPNKHIKTCFTMCRNGMVYYKRRLRRKPGKMFP